MQQPGRGCKLATRAIPSDKVIFFSRSLEEFKRSQVKVYKSAAIPSSLSTPRHRARERRGSAFPAKELAACANGQLTVSRSAD